MTDISSEWFEQATLDRLCQIGFRFYRSGMVALSAVLAAARRDGYANFVVPVLTCERVLAAIVVTGGEYHIADCADGELNSSLTEIENAHRAALPADGGKVGLIVTCHWGHWPKDLAAIRAWAAAHDVLIVYDLANSALLLRDWDYRTPNTIISFGREKPLEIGFGGAALVGTGAGAATDFSAIACDDWSYKVAIDNLKKRHAAKSVERETAFGHFCAAQRGTGGALDPAVLRGGAAGHSLALGAAKRLRQQRQTDLFVEASVAGGWLPLRSVQPDMNYATRLIGEVDPGMRDRLVRELRQRGLWIGLESSDHLGRWDASGDYPNADAIGSRSLSFLTSQQPCQARLAAAILRWGLP